MSIYINVMNMAHLRGYYHPDCTMIPPASSIQGWINIHNNQVWERQIDSCWWPASHSLSIPDLSIITAPALIDRQGMKCLLIDCLDFYVIFFSNKSRHKSIPRTYSLHIYVILYSLCLRSIIRYSIDLQPPDTELSLALLVVKVGKNCFPHW